ncbi:MAG: hypothetical protein WC711_00855 [Candidatus Staskawiczbacteria bacterium]|jgi:hypothetical protein
MFKFNKEHGQASKLLLVLAVVILVAVIITFLILKMTEKPPAPPVTPEVEVPLPVYEKTLGNIRFVFLTAIDKGNVLKGSEAVNAQFSNAKDLVIGNPGAKFITVTMGAQNVGTINTDKNAWKIENIIDSRGRNFVPLDGYVVSAWIPNPNLCGNLLKPAFDPTPCTKIYEVSKESTGLKVRVMTGKNNSTANNNIDKNDTFLIDLIVK